MCAGICMACSSFAFADDKPSMPTQMQGQQKQVDQTTDAAKKTMQGAQDAAKDAQKKGADAMQGMDPKKMEEMMKSMTPGEQHQKLGKFVGEWDVKASMWMAPGAPPEESTGFATTKSDFGGRFVFMTYKSEMMGQPFEGRLAIGFNNNTKQYEACWLDNMSTGMWNSTGTCSSDGNTFTWNGTFVEPDGEKKATREVTTFKGPDNYTSEFFETGKDGKENKMMQLDYTRKGARATTNLKPAGSTEPSK